ncbi:MAG TPA: Hpt domain-containing protein [Ideonella sp.]|uniref:Hpt domain-containing protein n=1 Tax=Ideonella sp. TaxID=1929293 RepID=UPI002C0F1AD7|nr:Hpt domain-containing protein [Ideonella sp.]HSI50025.1 Hpt domain-containing protein [Ideonella sp.]
MQDAGDNAPVLDSASLDQLRALDPQGSSGFVKRVLDTFLRSLQNQREAVAAATASGDLKALSHAAHALKSASASVGALPLSRLCAALEEAVRLDQPERVPALALKFESAAVAADAAVRALLEGGAA